VPTQLILPTFAIMLEMVMLNLVMLNMTMFDMTLRSGMPFGFDDLG
jgi:hypothetical protein